MKSKTRNNIKESEVEEALVNNLFYLRDLLGLTQDLKLIARQLKMKGGEQRLDLLLFHGKELCLVELKITKFFKEHIKQIDNYRMELIKLQNLGKLVSGNLRAFLLVTGFSQNEKLLCTNNQIEVVKFDPLEFLNQYFQNLSAVSPFLKIKPSEFGVYSFGLINRVLFQLKSGNLEIEAMSKETNLSKSSIAHHLRFAQEFGLVRERKKKFFLTDFGDTYAENINQDALIETISDFQAEMLKKFIAKDPFYSSTVFGIYSIVESAFILSRNSYPLEFDKLVKIFRTLSGKETEWQSARTQTTSTYTFLNFAISLGLLGKIGKSVVITPAGFRFILMLQLHKSIEMIESINSSKGSI